MTEPLQEKPTSASHLWRVIAAAVVLALIVLFFVLQRNESLLEGLIRQQTRWTSMLQAHPLLVVLAAFGLYVLVTGLSLPGAAVLTLLISYLLQQSWPGWRGGIVATVLVSFASTSGASCAFVLTRYLFRDAVTRRLGPRLRRFDGALQEEGTFYLFALRLIPVVPFFVINLAAGLTPIRLRTFWWVSQLGMLPGTIAYVVVGASLPNLDSLLQGGSGELLSARLFIALGILGLLPIGSRWLVKWWRGRKA
ncbi:MAG: TVP38/TMEM64 family protein [Pirellulales bacterium]|nr:TVP38/TMEM64 family protein [Pirellulales bacterium]